MQQSSHPAHLEGKVSSSFIPFCAYKSNLILSRNPLWFSNISFPLCSSFKPTMLEGQLCHKIELNGKTDTGRVNELMMLLDYNEDRWLMSRSKNEMPPPLSKITTLRLNLDRAGDIQRDKAKISVETLSDSFGFGGGSYLMTDVKRMTATTAFLDMSREDRKCDIERFQDCRTRRLLEACQCVPGELEDYFVAHKQKYGRLSTLKRCDPNGRDCIESKHQEKFNCSVSCEGLYADKHREDKVNLRPCEKTSDSSEKLRETSDGEGRTSKQLIRMVKEYKRFKKTLVQIFDFNPSDAQAKYGEAIFSRNLQVVL